MCVGEVQEPYFVRGSMETPRAQSRNARLKILLHGAPPVSSVS